MTWEAQELRNREAAEADKNSMPDQMISACYECGSPESMNCGHGKLTYMKKWQAANVAIVYELRTLMNI